MKAEPPRPTAEIIEVKFFRLVHALGKAQAAAIRDEGCVNVVVADLDRRRAAGRSALPKDEAGFRFDRCHF